jgi:hypothetical protein
MADAGELQDGATFISGQGFSPMNMAGWLGDVGTKFSL